MENAGPKLNYSGGKFDPVPEVEFIEKALNRLKRVIPRSQKESYLHAAFV